MHVQVTSLFVVGKTFIEHLVADLEVTGYISPLCITLSA